MKRTALWALMALILFSCISKKTKPEFDEKSEREKILELHEVQRQYHLDKDARAFAGLLSANFISVNRGVVQKPTFEENVEKFNEYFSSVEFIKWDDTAPPVIRFSEDGTMAYTVVKKMVELTYQDAEGEINKEKTEFAWVTIYKKYGDEWKIDCVASTNKPENKVILQ